jgi:glutaredoxin 2
MTREEFNRMLQRDKERKEKLSELLNETIAMLREIKDDLQKKELMLKYKNSVNNIYEAETPVKGSLGQGEQ